MANFTAALHLLRPSEGLSPGASIDKTGVSRVHTQGIVVGEYFAFDFGLSEAKS
ncbi:MAG: hypothetical protein IPI77_08445 [Saprospiraceae bacterium]|nr:hypothetical protein [Saprospiraceae bacterium]